MTIRTKPFSWERFGLSGVSKPIICFFELTQRCPLHCEHCYLNCSNNPSYSKKELSTDQIKHLLDKIKDGGVLLLVFTGGDPLIRRDFAKIYEYAHRLGFIVGILSSIVALSDDVFSILKRYKPFKIVTTLDAATAEKYAQITKTRYFRRHVMHIKKLLRNDIRVEVKTLITKRNIKQINEIEIMINSFGLPFRPGAAVIARINGDTTPCRIRLNPKDIAKISIKYPAEEFETGKDVCLVGTRNLDLVRQPRNNKLFVCGAGTYNFIVSPQGRMLLCSSLRKPDYNLLSDGSTVVEGFRILNRWKENSYFNTNSLCRSCAFRRICCWCPAEAYLEKGDLEKPIDHYCRLSKEMVRLLRKQIACDPSS